MVDGAARIETTGASSSVKNPKPGEGKKKPKTNGTKRASRAFAFL